ncbi:MAG: DNA-3-methyladenine glycosylase family protein [Arenicella sp.]
MLDELKIRQDLEQLATTDGAIAKALGDYGYPAPRIRSHGFESFASIVIGQQVSVHAAAAIEQRFWDTLPEASAAGVLAVSAEQLKKAGLSQRKMDYIQSLARLIVDGEFDPQSLTTMSDQDAIDAITHLRGFGVWSAKIYLMFSLQRCDVFPEQDLALLKGLQALYGLSDMPTPAQGLHKTLPWSPYRSAGSLFLWHYYHQITR